MVRAVGVTALPPHTNESAIHQLPLARWASRFQSGTVVVRGTLAAEANGAGTRLPAGPITIVFGFRGGATPHVTQVEVRAGAASVLLHEDEDAIGVLDRLVHAMSELEFTATALPDGELVVRFGFGLQLGIDANAEVKALGAATGHDGSLRLSRPLEIRCGGDGILVGHRKLDLVARLARVRISGATLHPDGSVELDGEAARPLSRAVRGGLRHTSRHLSDFVRRSPALGRFLS